MEPNPEKEAAADQADAQSPAQMRIRVRHLKDQSREDDLDGTTIEQRWDMMWPLAVTAWAFMGVSVTEDDSARKVARLIR